MQKIPVGSAVSDLGIALSGSLGESDDGLFATSPACRRRTRYYTLVNRMSAITTLTSISQGVTLSMLYAYHPYLPDDEGRCFCLDNHIRLVSGEVRRCTSSSGSSTSVVSHPWQLWRW
jgi:hypothetical protein